MADDISYNSPEYKAWRYACLVRDNFTCAFSGKKGGELEVHHIVPFASDIKLRYVVSNGITLSKEVHTMVSGNEDKYEKIFKEIVKKNTERQYLRSNGIKPDLLDRNYKPKNPKLRF